METNVSKLIEDFSLCKEQIRKALDTESETLYVYVELLKALRKEINSLGMQCFTVGISRSLEETTIEPIENIIKIDSEGKEFVYKYVSVRSPHENVHGLERIGINWYKRYYLIENGN